jgi:glycerol kinase
MNTLVIDQGSSSTKALVITEDGAVVSMVEIPVTTFTTPDGGVELDPTEVLTSIVNAGRQAIATSPVSVDAVGVANQGEAVVSWDKRSGRATSPIISWQDRRSSSLVASLQHHGPLVHERTGLPLDPYFTAPKLRWLRERSPASSMVTGIDAWVNRQLVGEAITDVATASRSLLLDLDTRGWSEPMLDLFGLSADDLPRLVGCAEIAGTTNIFGPTLPLAALIVDQQAALIGEDCLEDGAGKCTYGTGAFLLLTTGQRAVRSTNGLSTSVAWATSSTHAYCLDGQVYTAGSAVSWLERIGLLTGPGDIDHLVATVPSDTFCVPAFAGLGAPQWVPHARAAFYGLSLATSRAELIYAVLEGVAAQIALVAAAATSDTGHSLTRLKVDGGLTRSHSFMQLQSDLLQLPLDVFASPHATAYGVDALVRHALTPTSPLRAASMAIDRSYEPRCSPDQAAQRLVDWRAAAERTLREAVLV